MESGSPSVFPVSPPYRLRFREMQNAWLQIKCLTMANSITATVPCTKQDVTMSKGEGKEMGTRWLRTVERVHYLF